MNVPILYQIVSQKHKCIVCELVFDIYLWVILNNDRILNIQRRSATHDKFEKNIWIMEKLKPNLKILSSWMRICVPYCSCLMWECDCVSRINKCIANFSGHNYRETLYLLAQKFGEMLLNFLAQEYLTITIFWRYETIHDSISQTFSFTRYSFQNMNWLCATNPSKHYTKGKS